MTSDQMFLSYRMLSPDAADYSQCLFAPLVGDDDSGAVAVCEDVFSTFAEEVPMEGDIQAVEDEAGQCKALIRITSVRIAPGRDIEESLPFYPERIADRLYCVLGYRVVFR